MATFDKSRDYGEIMGDAQGRRYVQDGIYFDAQFRPLGEPVAEPVSAAEKDATVSRRRKSVSTEAQFLAQLEG